MKPFTHGKYLGQNSEQVRLEGLLITKSYYKEDISSDWHYHQNPYMTFILKGGSKEKRKGLEIECAPGMLVCYPEGVVHRNLNYKNNSKNLSLEFDDKWFKKFNIEMANFEGKCLLDNPVLKCTLLRTVAELPAFDAQTGINLEAALLASFSASASARNIENKPAWVKKLCELLHDERKSAWNLSELSVKLDIHPVTISKYFPRYFKTNIGDYIRMLKIERSLPLLSQKSISLEDVAVTSGFVDNGHYTRVFNKHTGVTPSCYRAAV